MKLLYTILFWVTACYCYSQTAIEYSYDPAGNRIQRKVITLGGGSEMQASTANATNGSPSVLAGIHDVKGNFTFTLFPNPTTSTVRIETDEAFSAMENRRLLLTDLSGKILIDRSFTERTEEIDFSKEANGEYLVKVIAGGQIVEWKVVKI